MGKSKIYWHKNTATCVCRLSGWICWTENLYSHIPRWTWSCSKNYIYEYGTEQVRAMCNLLRCNQIVKSQESVWDKLLRNLVWQGHLRSGKREAPCAFVLGLDTSHQTFSKENYTDTVYLHVTHTKAKTNLFSETESIVHREQFQLGAIWIWHGRVLF